MDSTAAARKTVSVLFCDLAGSTTLGELLDPEPLRELMGAWYEAMRQAVERHGGQVEKFIGDAVMAVFGLPRTHEDDALRTVSAALEMQTAVRQLNASLAARGGPELSIRIGINTGEVVTGGDAATLVTGDAVNTAKRLEQAAAGGEILIGAVTEQLVRHAARLEPAGPVDAKGKSRPIEAWRVLGKVAGAEVFARRWDTRFVGRRHELSVLHGELTEAAESRSCRLITVVGAAGVGKTRLTVELVGELDEHATVLTGRCLPYGDGITFRPLTELIRDLGGKKAIADAVRDESDGALIAERLGVLAGGAATGPAEELFWAVRRLLEALAREQPLLVVLEDVHWAEPRLLDLVEYISRWSAGAPILLLCLARPELLEEYPRWEGAVVRLEPLSAAEAFELLDGLESGRVLSPETRSRVTEAAQGNPLYAEQLVAMLAEGGTDRELTSLPPTIQALLAARLDRLDAAQRDVLERAAVIGREFWPGAVGALGEAEESLGATLLELVRLDLVEPAPTSIPGEDGFRFRHGLIRDAAYTSAPLRRRAAHHERFAEWLASGATPAQDDEIRGYHLERTVHVRQELGIDDEHTNELAHEGHRLLADAGFRAFANGDTPAARNLLERALALEDGGFEERRILGHALWDAGEMDRAIDLFEAVAADAAAAGDRAHEWYARLDAAAAVPHMEKPEDLVAFLETAAEAVEVFSELGDERGLSRAWRRISRAELTRCSYAAAEAAGERALQLALRSGHRQDMAGAADALATALLWGPTHTTAAARRCEELLAQAEANEPLRGNVLIALAGLRALQGDFAAARRLRVEAEAIHRDLGLRMLLAGQTEIAAQIERLAGDPVAAEAELRRGLELLAGAGETQAAVHRGWLAAALADQGRYEEARESGEAARRGAPAPDVLAQVVWRGVLARVEAAAGNVDQALSLAHEAVDRAALTDGLAMRAESLLDLAAVLEMTGDSDGSTRAAREAGVLYEEKGRIVPSL